MQILSNKQIDPKGSVDRLQTFVEIRDRYIACLDDIKQRGVRINKSRLAAYANVLRDLAKDQRPPLANVQAEPERWRRASIALTEAYQIIESQQVWPSLSSAGFVALLRKIRRGKPFAEDDQVSQNARSTGLELAMATNLYKLGFHVDVSINDADITAQAASFGRVIVECKRPQNFTNASKNILIARDQILKRARHGIVAVGIDRIVGLGDRASVASTEEELDARLDFIIQEEFRRAVAPIVKELFPTVVAVAIAFTAIVFVDDGVVHQRNVAAFCPTIPEEHPDHAELAERFDGLRRR